MASQNASFGFVRTAFDDNCVPRGRTRREQKTVTPLVPGPSASFVWKLNREKQQLVDINLIAVARNFNGLPGSAARFQQLLSRAHDAARVDWDISPLSLISDNLRDPRARHLMLISRGDAATCLLRLPQIKEALHNPHIMLASRFDCL